MDSLQTSLKNRDDKLIANETEITILREKLSDLSASLSSEESQLSSKLTATESLLAEKEESLKQKNSLLIEKDESLSQRQQEIDNLNTSIATLMEEIRIRDQSVSEMTDVISKLNEEKSQSVATLEISQAEISSQLLELKSINSNLEESNQSLQSSLDTSKAAETQLHDDLASKSSQLSQTLLELETSKKTIDGLQFKLDELQQRQALEGLSVSETVNQLETLNSSLRLELSMAMQDVALKDKLVDELQQTKAYHDMKVSETNKELESLKESCEESIQSFKQKNESLMNDLMAKESQAKTANDRIAWLESQLSQLTFSFHEKEEEFSRYETTITQLKALSADLSQKLVEKSDGLMKLNESINQMHMEKTDLIRTNQNLQQSNDQNQLELEKYLQLLNEKHATASRLMTEESSMILTLKQSLEQLQLELNQKSNELNQALGSQQQLNILKNQLEEVNDSNAKQIQIYLEKIGFYDNLIDELKQKNQNDELIIHEKQDEIERLNFLLTDKQLELNQQISSQREEYQQMIADHETEQKKLMEMNGQVMKEFEQKEELIQKLNHTIQELEIKLKDHESKKILQYT